MLRSPLVHIILKTFIITALNSLFYANRRQLFKNPSKKRASSLSRQPPSLNGTKYFQKIGGSPPRTAFFIGFRNNSDTHRLAQAWPAPACTIYRAGTKMLLNFFFRAVSSSSSTQSGYCTARLVLHKWTRWHMQMVPNPRTTAALR